MIRLTSSPAILPASLVAWRWSSLKYAGTVITALSTLSPRSASASAFSFWRIIALISGGAYSLPPALTRASPFGPGMTSNGTIFSSSLTSASLRPMKRLIEKTVFSGFVTACRLAGAPTRRSPPSVNATTEGVVRAPSAFSITVGSPPSRTAMHELVVPRSMPIVLPIRCAPLLLRGRSERNLSASMADVHRSAHPVGAWNRLPRPMRRLLPSLLALLAAIVLGACGSDSDDPAADTAQAKSTEQPSPARQQEALRDTAVRPHIPKPTGSPPRRLEKEDLVKGKGPPAKPGDTLTVNYVGVTFSTGEEFDASWDRGQPFDLPLGAGRVIKGWDRG